MKKSYKKYDRAFKENAIRLSCEKKSIREAADELGIRLCLLSRWRKELQRYGEGSFRGSGHHRFHPDDREVFDLGKAAIEAELRYEILKNASGVLHQGDLAVYGFIRENEHRYSILKMCAVLEVGYGRYHRWRKGGLSAKKRHIARLKEDLKALFARFKKHYGRNRLTEEMHKLGYRICREQVSFYMRQMGLRRIRKRKFKPTTDSGHQYYTAPNILNRRFKAYGHSQVWTSDITYLQTSEGFLYLTIIIDLYDRKIVGWNLGSKLASVATTLPAFNMAASRRAISKGMIFHSDRGVQYANRAFVQKLACYGITRSMSRKGCSSDNAVSESFFSSLKRELLDGKKSLFTREQMKDQIYEFIEEWYNAKRIHTYLNCRTIKQFNDECHLERGLQP